MKLTIPVKDRRVLTARDGERIVVAEFINGKCAVDKKDAEALMNAFPIIEAVETADKHEETE